MNWPATTRLVAAVVVAGLLVGAGGTPGMAAGPTATDRAVQQSTPDPTPTPARDEDPRPVDVAVTGSAVAGGANGTGYLLPEAPFTVVVRLGEDAARRVGEACLYLRENESVGWRGCEPFGGDGRARFTFDRWPTEGTDLHELGVSLNGTAVPIEAGGMTGLRPVEPTGDVDDDGLPNERERALGTHLAGADTDQDGLFDGPEVKEYGTDPRAADTDDDGLRDAQEIQIGTDPTLVDTDGDGVADGAEVENGMDPHTADTDGDGLDDGEELRVGTDPVVGDTDHDRVADGTELRAGTNPRSADSDGDLVGDAVEFQLGTDPTNPWMPLLPVVAIGLGLVLGAGMALQRSDHDVTLLASVRTALAGALAPSATDGTVSDGTDAEEPMDPVLTDEERVLEMLERAGGREKQVNIVEGTDWSKAKVSRVLSRMEEAGTITRIKIGRENLVCLEGDVPQGVQSPLEG